RALAHGRRRHRRAPDARPRDRAVDRRDAPHLPPRLPGRPARGGLRDQEGLHARLHETRRARRSPLPGRPHEARRAMAPLSLRRELVPLARVRSTAVIRPARPPLGRARAPPPRSARRARSGRCPMHASAPRRAATRGARGGPETSARTPKIRDCVDLWRAVGIRLPSMVRPFRRAGEPELSEGMRLLDRYTILDRIGSGGVATILRAESARLRRGVCVKLLRTTLVEGSNDGNRAVYQATYTHFLQEALALS